MTGQHPGAMRQEILLTLSEPATAAELQAMGLHDVVVTGRHALATADAAEIARLTDYPVVKTVSFSKSGKLFCDLSRKASNVDQVRAGSDGLPQGFTGKGVVVGLFDKGFDFNHINFLTGDLKESRIRRVWMYAPEGNSFKETSYTTPEAIKALGTDDSLYTHGTHTLGIMAGAFKYQSDSISMDYSGMAPDADILVGCGTIDYSNVIRAIQHFQAYADSVGKPLVVSLSLGDNLGPHDGTDAYTAAFNELGAKTPIVMSVGNNGNNPISIVKKFTSDDPEIKTVVAPNSHMNQYYDVSWEAVSEIQVWSEDKTPFNISVGLWSMDDNDWLCQVPISPTGRATYLANGTYASYATLPDDDFDELYQNSFIGLGSGVDGNSGRYMADVAMMLQHNMQNIDHHVVPALIVKGKAGKRVYVYGDGNNNILTANGMAGWDNGTGEGSVSNIACGKNTISVGSYCTRAYLQGSKEGHVSPFSAWGTLSDGRTLPDMVASGDAIVSSMSTPFTASEAWSKDSYPAVTGMMYGNTPMYWTVLSGTSQATPAVAGIMALWLQADSTLSPARLKEIATSTAAAMPETNGSAGKGKVDALAGMKMVLKDRPTAINALRDSHDGAMTVSGDGRTFTFVLGSGRAFSASVYALDGRCLWQGHTSNGSMTFHAGTLPTGVYVVKTNAAGRTSNQKLIIK